MSQAEIRQARESDVPALIHIYERYVHDTAVTFEYEVPTPEEFTRRVRAFSAEFPYLVCLIDGVIVGYAYAHRQRERAAYQWNAELSVYVNWRYLRRGIGRAMYTALIELLRLQRYRNVFGVVTSPNPCSEKLHEAFGFRRAGVFYDTGFKRGSWYDVVEFEKKIGSFEGPPEPPLSIRELAPEEIDGVLSKCAGMVRATVPSI